MKLNTYSKYLFLFILIIGVTGFKAEAQTGDQLPVREYTNPEEVVTFDRTTSFSRALDIVNQFAQQYRGKMILDRTGTDGNVGISIPPMHWMDALQMILNVKQLRLIEQPEYYEIVYPEQPQESAQASGNLGNQQEGEGLIVNTGTREVRINAIFFEGNRRALSEIGVDWSTLSDNVPESAIDNQGGGGQGGDGGQIPSAEFEGPFVQVNSRGAQNVSQSVFDALVNFGEIGNSGIDVQALFSAFEADNLGEILASPTVKVMDGEEGRIQVGQDFSIKQRDFAGNVVEQFFSVGTILTVTPQIIEQQDTTFIHLDISAERSSAQPDPVSTVINKTQAETQSLLMDDEATVIAGLYRTEYAEVRRGLPVLKDLPPWFFGLRYLFGYSSKDFQTRELVIILQATIEPSIPDRYGKEYLNKYEILEDERHRMQNDVELSRKLTEGETIKEEDLEDTEIDSADDAGEPAYSVPEEPEAQVPDTTETSEDMQNDPVQEDPEIQTEDEQDTTVISDPEIEEQEIEVNLGGEAEQDTAAMEGQQNLDTAFNYYIVGGVFRLEENAQQFSDQLRQQGHEPVILQSPSSGSKMVAYRGYDNRKEAKEDLQYIQQNVNKAAWLFEME